MPIEGQSMLASFTDPGVEGRRTQYFEMMGNRGIYHEGFMASCFHGRVPWIRFGSVPFDGPQESWELYDLRDDFSQSHDLADERPELLAEMRDLFDAECLRNGVYPLRDAAMNLDPAIRAPSVPVGVTRHRTQWPRGQVGPPGPHPAQPSSSLDPGGERRPIPPPLALAPLIPDALVRGPL